MFEMIDWDSIIPALAALCGAIAAVFGSHKKLKQNIACNKDELQELIDELLKLRDEFKRRD